MSRKPSPDLTAYHRHYDEFVARHYRGFRETWEILAELADAAITQGDLILNVGAGHSSRMEAIFQKRARAVYALDPDPAALAKNRLADRTIVGKAEAIPLEDASVDVVVMEWVLEHIADPAAACAEIHRVLKPGGRLIFATPNILGPTMMGLAVLKRLSERASEALIQTHLKDVGEGDVYPAYYRANTERRLRHLFDNAGLTLTTLQTTGNPGYFRFLTPLLWLSLQWEKISARPGMGWSQAYLLGIATKPKAPQR